MGYLFAAVSVVWIGSFAYIVWLRKEERRLQEELSHLRSVLEKMKGN